MQAWFREGLLLTSKKPIRKKRPDKPPYEETRKELNMTKQHKLLSLAACLSTAFAATAFAADAPAAADNQKVDLPRTLEGYVSQDKAFWDYLKANHPYFKNYL